MKEEEKKKKKRIIIIIIIIIISWGERHEGIPGQRDSLVPLMIGLEAQKHLPTSVQRVIGAGNERREEVAGPMRGQMAPPQPPIHGETVHFYQRSMGQAR